MNNLKMPFEEMILNLAAGEQTVIFIKGRQFVIKPAEDEELDKPHKGYECFD